MLNQRVEPGRLSQLPWVARFPAEEAIEKVYLAVDDVPQRRDNRAVGAWHGGVKGLLAAPPAKLQDLSGRPGIVPDGIVQRVSHLDLPTAAQPVPLTAFECRPPGSL